MDNKEAPAAKENVTPPGQFITGQVQIHQTYEGPIPSPSIMEAYARVDFTFPERIMRDFENNSQHVREKAIKELDASIAEKKRGQWMAFMLSLLLLGIIGLSLWLGNTTFAGIGSFAFVGLLIRSFINTKATKTIK